MKIYEISFGTGTIYLHTEKVIVEDFDCAQDAFDKMIDSFEERGLEGFFLTQEEINSGNYGDDEYSVGGNHGRYLAHYGCFYIKELEDFSNLHKYVLTNDLSFSGYEEDEYYSSRECELFENDIKKIHEIDKIINETISKTQNDLAEYIDDEYKNKIYSILPKVEFDENKNLIGKTTILTTEELTIAERIYVKNYLIGQFSDGWGESFEQQEIKLKGEDFVSICVSFWTGHTSYSLRMEN